MLRYHIMPVTPFQQNCTLFWCDETQEGALVDPGGEVDRLIEEAEKLGVTIKHIWVTHGHIDHAGAVADVADRLQIPIEGPHEDDTFWIDSMEDRAGMFGFPPCRSFRPQRWLQQGDTVRVGNLTFQVLHCPGHTPGHVVFYQPEAKLAQVGDVIFAGSIGRTDFPRGNHQHLIQSIRERLFPLGDDVAFIPGHGPMSTFGEERHSNPYVGDFNFARR